MSILISPKKKDCLKTFFHATIKVFTDRAYCRPTPIAYTKRYKMKNINRVKKQFFDLEQVLKKQISPKSLLERMESADIASFLSYEDQYTAQVISVLIEIQKLGSVLEEMPSDKLIPLLRDMPKEHIDSLFASAQMDDLIYLLKFIEPEKQNEIVARSSRKEQIQKFLKYSENRAGRIMRTPVFALPAQMSAAESIRKLRERSLEEFIFYVYWYRPSGTVNWRGFYEAGGYSTGRHSLGKAY